MKLSTVFKFNLVAVLLVLAGLGYFVHNLNDCPSKVKAAYDKRMSVLSAMMGNCDADSSCLGDLMALQRQLHDIDDKLLKAQGCN